VPGPVPLHRSVPRRPVLRRPVLRRPLLLRRPALAGVGLALAALPALVPAPASAAPASAAASSAPAASRAAEHSLLETPLVFGHRGASGYRPEHTLESYALAIAMGADVVEPDVVSTKDRVLVTRHENEISGTTDVADHPEFADRKATKTIDGLTVTGWFTEDFTYAELRTLRARERLPEVRQENTIYDGRFRIPTLQQVIDLVQEASERTGREIGIAPETKHPTYFDSIGKSLEEPLVRALRRNGLADAGDPVYVQSFEEANLRVLNKRIDVDLVQLTSAGTTARPYDHVAAGDPETYAQMTSRAGLRTVARYADVVGPDKSQVFPLDATGRAGAPTSLIRDAHAVGLLVVPYTFRAENVFLPAQYDSGADPTAFGDLIGEIQAGLRAGLDGVFTDQPDIGVYARDEFVGR